MSISKEMLITGGGIIIGYFSTESWEGSMIGGAAAAGLKQKGTMARNAFAIATLAGICFGCQTIDAEFLIIPLSFLALKQLRVSQRLLPSVLVTHVLRKGNYLGEILFITGIGKLYHLQKNKTFQNTAMIEKIFSLVLSGTYFSACGMLSILSFQRGQFYLPLAFLHTFERKNKKEAAFFLFLGIAYQIYSSLESRNPFSPINIISNAICEGEDLAQKIRIYFQVKDTQLGLN